VNDTAYEASDVEINDPIQLEMQGAIAQLMKVASKSAPTSANGSSNPNPILDIQVTLPEEHDSEDDEGDSETRRERR
jgi:hypothetical protein